MPTKRELKEAIYNRLAFKYFSGANADGLKDLLREESGSTEINALSTDTEKEQVRIADIYDDGLAEIIADEIIDFYYTVSGVYSDYTITTTSGEPDVSVLVGYLQNQPFSITLPDPADCVNIPITIIHDKTGYGLMDRGNCESTTAPMISGESTPTTDNIQSYTRSDSEAYAGDHSWSVVGLGSTWRISFNDSILTNDLHGLTASGIYTLSMWIKPASGNTGLFSDAFVMFQYYDDVEAVWVETKAYGNDDYASDWQRLEATTGLNGNATGVDLGFRASNATSGDQYYIDEVRLIPQNDLTVVGQFQGKSEIVLPDRGDRITVRSNGRYFEVDYQSLSREYVGGTPGSSMSAYLEYNRIDRSIDFVFPEE